MNARHLLATRLLDGGDLQPGEEALVLDHPAVSRRHARFAFGPQGLVLEDLGSTNGSFVNGQRVAAARELAASDLVQIGPFRLLYDGRQLHRLSNANHEPLVVHGAVREVPRPGGQSERILDAVSLAIQPGTLTCVIGGSGSGKSTLINVMTGRVRPEQGQVRLGALDLHQHFAVLKQDLAYLPQAEIVHEALTVRQALDYAARLRLPRDCGEAQRRQAVEEAAAAVGLEHRMDTAVGALSGGQRKRVCLAAEILSKPSLLFVDEATSGLDEVTDREIMGLLKRLTREGMTIVCVTHTLANLYEHCDALVVMAPGGVLAFHGSPREALQRFGVATLGDVLGAADTPGQAAAGTGTAPAAAGASNPDAPAPPAPAAPGLAELRHQFSVLASRNLRLLLADRRALAMALLQCVAIGTILGYVFSSFGEGPAALMARKSCLLQMALSAIWVGCNTASKDIVGERPIFLRERDVNLSPAAFVLAKFCVTGGLNLVQVSLTTLAATLWLPELPGGLAAQFPWLVGVGASGVALGLVISALCRTREQANILVPLAVAPQLILGGGMAPDMPAPAQWAATLFTSVEHARIGLHAGAGLIQQADTSAHAWALPVQTALLLACAWLLSRRRSL